MPERHLFEYAVIRVVPRVEREEFLNVGVILYCKQRKFLQLRCNVDENRLQALCCDLDLDELKSHLNAFEQICIGSKTGGPIAQLEPAERFRWLTAYRSTIVQASRVHPGLCIEPEATLEKLYAQLVL
ncbi:DUF3037 domain-containing protein [Mucilaginibacter sp. RS28]|uniref:DUF3037 domain-containing protein n=1 Tax=Mucilaginibacter straminoryzae TaxID=2932774 RepID=A0A9X2BBN9_9SPHI|nr:DUF3037 domain-containing protein [Mucilaginibacter straminoryzae]MCJ8210047.1 DUF3037 domain-containing protein [Mucilaginibacter straminoryzae]